MKRRFLTIFISGLCLFTTMHLYAAVSGNSAWLYGKSKQWVDQINHFNERKNFNSRLNYLFPEAAVVHVNEKDHTLVYRYDTSTTRFYKSALPDIRILPDFSFWVAHTNFMLWSENEFKSAAITIANHINNDPNADGVFIDLENFQPALLPFYKALAFQLNKKHKILSVIVRPGQENVAWFSVMGDDAFVVLYGYDLHQPSDTKYPVSPEIYKERLATAYRNLLKIATMTHTHVMGGVPAIATTYEWEEKITSSTGHPQHIISHYQQIHYLTAALDTYSSLPSELYMGYSIWAFVDSRHNHGINELPYQISDECWKVLLQHASG